MVEGQRRGIGGKSKYLDNFSKAGQFYGGFAIFWNKGTQCLLCSTQMNKTTIRLSAFAQTKLKEIAKRKNVSVSQLINEIALRYIGAEEGALMMQERAKRGAKEKALEALEAVRRADRDPLPGDELPKGLQDVMASEP